MLKIRGKFTFPSTYLSKNPPIKYDNDLNIIYVYMYILLNLLLYYYQ